MEPLETIYAAISLLGVHITRPFHELIFDSCIITIVIVCDFINSDLATIPTSASLSTNQVTTFASDNIFFGSKPESCANHVLQENISQYCNEIENILCIVLPKLALGFDLQKRANVY